MNKARFLPCALVLIAVVALTPTARAEDPGFSKVGIGFHDVAAPLGVRWWVGHNTALDIGFGFASDPFNDLRLNRGTVRLGAPTVIRRFGRLAAEVRPGIGYSIEQTIEYSNAPTFTYRMVNDHVIEPSLQLEAEVLVVDHLSVSGAFGFGATIRKLGATDETVTSWSTTAGNFAHFGLHLYLGDPR